MDEHPAEIKDIVKNNVEVWKGIGLTVLLHFFQLFGYWMSFAPALFIGLTQLLYMVPALVYFTRKSRSGIVQGLTIGMAVTFLLNAACFGYVMLNLGG